MRIFQKDSCYSQDRAGTFGSWTKHVGCAAAIESLPSVHFEQYKVSQLLEFPVALVARAGAAKRDLIKLNMRMKEHKHENATSICRSKSNFQNERTIPSSVSVPCSSSNNSK
jgi:hypothetical protein